MKSVLMQDKQLWRHNLVISCRAKYISGICKTIENTKLIDQKTKNNAINFLFNHNFMNTHSQNNDTFRQESLRSKCEHQKHNIITK